MNTRFCATIAAAAALLQACPAAAADQGAQYVSVRTTSAVPESVIEYIARISEPLYLNIPAGETPEGFISRKCGSYTKAFARVFNEINNVELATKPVSSVRNVKMPACLIWRNVSHNAAGDRITGIPVKVLPGDTLDIVLRRKIGLTRTDKLVCAPGEPSLRCNKTFGELVQMTNPGRNLDALDTDNKDVVLPLETQLTTFRVKRVKVSEGLTAQQVVDEIARLARQPALEGSIIRNVVAPNIRLLAAVPADELDPANTACRDPASVSRRPWPYDARELGDILKRTWELAKKQSRAGLAVVTVIDTGLATSFPAKFLKRDDRRENNVGVGISIDDPTRVTPYPEYEASWHGTQVAEILTGGPALRAAFPDLSQLLQINVVNLVQAVHQVGPGGYEIRSSGVNEGVNFAVENAQLANISIGSDKELSSSLHAIKDNNSNKLLLIAAAGNEKKNLTSEALYPANYGGEHPDGGTQVITVAAHDGNGAIAEFSNRSDRYVDLAAPGCAVPYGPGPDDVQNGTSFAAPLVSMTAALLRAFGLKPNEVKTRLRASVDHAPELEDAVLWSGRLNVAKTLSLYDDVLETRSQPKLKFFQWNPGGNVLELCRDRMGDDLETIKKITSLSATEPYRIRIEVSDSQRVLDAQTCEPKGTGLPHLDPANNQVEIPWSDLVDLVPRFYEAPAIAPEGTPQVVAAPAPQAAAQAASPLPRPTPQATPQPPVPQPSPRSPLPVPSGGSG